MLTTDVYTGLKICKQTSWNNCLCKNIDKSICTYSRKRFVFRLSPSGAVSTGVVIPWDSSWINFFFTCCLGLDTSLSYHVSLDNDLFSWDPDAIGVICWRGRGVGGGDSCIFFLNKLNMTQKFFFSSKKIKVNFGITWDIEYIISFFYVCHFLISIPKTMTL